MSLGCLFPEIHARFLYVYSQILISFLLWYKKTHQDLKIKGNSL